ncbi:hypothetical protein S7S_10560 [Isoalcanivorax pacificus W11-5]|uniref:SGNH hydrolase-type esterase domain-containing protein n=1 Tax=Isoalcanivorax pacificus W11-5 TaxID=391936 RepID=A0A0B4XJT8_9GAMM|nr:hypothetical protein S7S_10560 [Isoalcanivorax pacificus W11-5]
MLGDSHAAVFKKPLLQRCRGGIRVISVSGATASGMKNPNSSTNALKIFKSQIERKKWKRIIFYLGEVDVGFVIWFRAEKYGLSIEKSAQEALESYLSVISHAKLASNAEIAVLSVPWPTIRDGHQMGEVANLRSKIKASYSERKNLTLNFNADLKSNSVPREFTYIDFDPCVCDESGELSVGLYNRNPADHHYDYDVFSLILFNNAALREFIAGGNV